MGNYFTLSLILDLSEVPIPVIERARDLQKRCDGRSRCSARMPENRQKFCLSEE